MSHIASNLVGYDSLLVDVQNVLDTLIANEIEVQAVSGEWYTMRILPYRTLDNVIEGVVMTFIDITRVKKAQKELMESEEKYRNLINYSPDAIIINHQDRIVFANQACVKLFGARSEAELIGKSHYELFHPDFHNQIRERIYRLRDLRESVSTVQEKIVRFDGSIVDVEVLIYSFLYCGSNDIHVIIRDITGWRKSKESSGQGSEEKP